MAAFFAVSTVVIATPGPDTALTIRNALLGGRRSGLFTALGVSSGQATWAVAAAAGLAALVQTSKPVFTAVRLIGAAYLTFLGAQALSAAMGADRNNTARSPRSAGPTLAWPPRPRS